MGAPTSRISRPYYGRHGHDGRHGLHRAAAHRNRSLVVNRSMPSQQADQNEEEMESLSGISQSDQGAVVNTPQATTPTHWVSKTDRHRQLINASVFEKNKSLDMDVAPVPEDQIAKGNNTSVDGAGPASRLPSNLTPQPSSVHYIEIDGSRFQVCNRGSKLRREKGLNPPLQPTWHTSNKHSPAGLDNQAHPTPKSAVISGIEFTRSKNGNLYRSDLMKEGRSVMWRAECKIWRGLKKLTVARPLTKKPANSEPCKRFTRTGTFRPPLIEQLIARPWQRGQASSLGTNESLGQCQFGPKCRFAHDPSQVAICREFLKSGNCPQGSHCDLSHTPSYERVPACTHFVRGNCSKADCRYAHVRVDPGADVCRAFTELGFCSKGTSCTHRHVFECPDYSQSGVCRDPNCRLPHVDRAGQLRKQARKESGTSEDPGSSKQPDLMEVDDPAAEAETDDISSDDLDEGIILGATNPSSHGLSQQADFVSL